VNAAECPQRRRARDVERVEHFILAVNCGGFPGEVVLVVSVWRWKAGRSWQKAGGVVGGARRAAVGAYHHIGW
jgi:hypothetical protein